MASLPSMRFDHLLLARVGAEADSADDQPLDVICAPMKLLSSTTVFGVSTVISDVVENGELLDAFWVTTMTLSGTVSRGSTSAFGTVTGGALLGEHGDGDPAGMTAVITVAMIAGGVRWGSLRIIATVPFRQNARKLGLFLTKPPGPPESACGTQPLDRNDAAQDSRTSDEIVGTSK